MAEHLFGNNITSLIETPLSGAFNLNAEGIFTVTRIWEADYDVCVANAPQPRSVDPLGTNALCIQVDISRRSPRIGTITAVYQGFLYLPLTVYELSNSRMERPISLHPDFNDVSKFPYACKMFEPVIDGATGAPTGKENFVRFKDSDQPNPDTNPNNKFRGIESYVVGSVQWRKLAYSQTPDFDALDVGKLSAPEAGPFTGLPDQSNSAGKWLKMEKNCRNIYKGASLLWEISEVWQYNDKGWLSEIYS